MSPQDLMENLLVAVRSVPERDNARVMIWDPDAQDWMPVTGMTVSVLTGEIKLYSDDNS